MLLSKSKRHRAHILGGDGAECRPTVQQDAQSQRCSSGGYLGLPRSLLCAAFAAQRAFWGPTHCANNPARGSGPRSLNMFLLGSEGEWQLSTQTCRPGSAQTCHEALPRVCHLLHTREVPKPRVPLPATVRQCHVCWKPISGTATVTMRGLYEPQAAGRARDQARRSLGTSAEMNAAPDGAHR